MITSLKEKLMHAFARLRNDADLFRIWYVVIGLIVMDTIADLSYGQHVDARLFMRGMLETVLALLAAAGRRWARTALGVVLAISSLATGVLMAVANPDIVRQVVYFIYAAGMAIAAAKAFRWF
jgi:hypothetical protein